jgi:phage-related protein
MLSNIYYFVDERGRNPVKEFISSLTVKEQAKVFAYINELLHQGHNLRRPIADYLTDGIYELRPKGNRIFYFFFLKDSVVFLHAIKKKTASIPRNDLVLCLERKAKVEGMSCIEEI